MSVPMSSAQSQKKRRQPVLAGDVHRNPYCSSTTHLYAPVVGSLTTLVSVPPTARMAAWGLQRGDRGGCGVVVGSVCRQEVRARGHGHGYGYGYGC